MNWTCVYLTTSYVSSNPNLWAATALILFFFSLYVYQTPSKDTHSFFTPVRIVEILHLQHPLKGRLLTEMYRVYVFELQNNNSNERWYLANACYKLSVGVTILYAQYHCKIDAIIVLFRERGKRGSERFRRCRSQDLESDRLASDTELLARSWKALHHHAVHFLKYTVWREHIMLEEKVPLKNIFM